MMKTFLTLCAATTAMAMCAQTQQISQREALLEILQNNAELQSLAAQNNAKTLSLTDEASSLADPQIDFEHLWGKTSDDNRWNVGVSQSFDWPGVYAKRRAAAKAQGEAIAYLYDAQCLEVVQQAKAAMIDAVYAQKRLNMLREVQSNIEKLSSLVQEGYDKGELTVLDVKKLKLELFSITTQISEVEQEFTEAIATIFALNSSKDMRIDFENYMAEQMLPLDTYLEQVTTSDPQVLAAKQSAEAAKLSAKAASASRLPGFSLGYRHAYEDGMHFNGFSVGVNLPLFSRRKAAQAATLEAQSASFDAISAASTVQTQMIALHRDVTRERKLLDELGAVTLDDSYPELLMMAYKGGQINALNYLLELNYFIEARTNLLNTEHCMRLDLARLNRYSLPE
jgi:outer membrane protein TolC